MVDGYAFDKHIPKGLFPFTAVGRDPVAKLFKRQHMCQFMGENKEKQLWFQCGIYRNLVAVVAQLPVIAQF